MDLAQFLDGVFWRSAAYPVCPFILNENGYTVELDDHCIVSIPVDLFRASHRIVRDGAERSRVDSNMDARSGDKEGAKALFDAEWDIARGQCFWAQR